MYHVEETTSSNTVALSGDAIAIDPAVQCLIVLRDFPLSTLATEFQMFQAELRSTLYEVLSMTGDEFVSWHGGKSDKQFAFEQGVLTPGACVGFKAYARARRQLAYLRQPAVLEAAIEEGALDRLTVTGLSRQDNTHGAGSIADLCQRLPLTKQREILRRIILNGDLDLDRAIHLTQVDGFDLKSVQDLIVSASATTEVLQGLAQALWQFDRQHAHNARHSWGAPWFVIYLVRQGYLLMPKLENDENLIPRLMKPLFWTLFVPRPSRSLALSIVSSSSRNAFQYVWAPFRHLLLSTNFFQIADFQGDVPHLMHLKEIYGSKKRQSENTAKIHGTNQIFKQYLSFFGRSYQDVVEVAAYFGGGIAL